MIVRLIFEARRGLPISVNWTFFVTCYDWRRYKRISLKNRRFRSNGPVHRKFQIELLPQQALFLSSNYLKWSFVRYKKIWIDIYSVLSHCTHLSDKRTDRQADTFLVSRSLCIQCSEVKAESTITFRKQLCCQHRDQDENFVFVLERPRDQNQSQFVITAYQRGFARWTSNLKMVVCCKEYKNLIVSLCNRVVHLRWTVFSCYCVLFFLFTFVFS